MTRTTQFATELQRIDASIARIGGMAEEQLAHALDALQSRDIGLAEQVIESDKAIDEMEAEIDDLVADVFVRRQPMAADLRTSLSSVKVASAIERIGDMAKNTARRSKTLTESPPLKLLAPIIRFGRETLNQFSASLEAYSRRDPELALEVWKQDEKLDDLYNGLMREIIAAMEASPSQIPLYTQAMFISKNMERIGDHATFIAETTHYIVTGERMKDERPKGTPDGLLEMGA